MSASGMSWAFAQKEVRGSELLTLIVIADGARSLESIAEASHASLDEAAAAVADLRARGYIVVDAPDRYQLPDSVEYAGRAAAEQPAYKRKPISTSKALQVFEKDGYACVHCNNRHQLTVDHIQPVSKGGSNDMNNLQTLCASCNSRKGAR